MTSNTAWVAGRNNAGAGLTWSLAFNTVDFTTSNAGGPLANGQTVLSSVAAIANGTFLDQFADISVRLSLTTSTILAGACLSFWIYELLDDGATYGDGQFVAGTARAATPTFSPCAAVPLVLGSQTSLVGFAQGIVLPPGSFKLAMQNNSGFTLTTSVVACQIRTYNMSLNA